MDGLERGAGFGTSELTVLRPKPGTNARYLSYLVQSERFRQLGVGAMTGAGGLKRVPDQFTRDFATAWPTSAEQDRVAAFLDEQLVRLDALLTEKMRLVERLTDFRLLAIRREVLGHAHMTGSPNPAPRGEPWLESIPSHWTIPKVKHILRTTSGSTPSTDKRDVYYDGDIPWIRSLDLPNGSIDAAEVHITEAALEDTACRLLPVGTVLLAMYGGDGTIGKSGLLGIEAACNQAVCAILPSVDIEPRYLHWYMVFRRPYWMVGADGTRKDPNISQDVVREARLPLPPRGEQVEIADRLDVATRRLDDLRGHVVKHIELLREYRASLISAAVTGQLDISTFKANR